MVAALVQGSAPAGVALDEDLTIGVWSPLRTRYVAIAPACISRSAEEPPGAYRVRVTGAATDRFALVNSVGDEIDYRVRWFENGDQGRNETLRPGVSSVKTFPLLEPADCLAGNGPGLQAKAARRDVDRAPPGVYRDTLVLTVEAI